MKLIVAVKLKFEVTFSFSILLSHHKEYVCELQYTVHTKEIKNNIICEKVSQQEQKKIKFPCW